jgi:GMP synthase (glutamine-hydrolysing)
MTHPLWILKLGDTVPSVAALRGDFDDWIAAGLGLPAAQLRTAQVHRGEPLPSRAEVGAVVLSGSAAMVTTREPWSERTAEWLAEAVAADLPILGICYGHQLLAQALGGRVGDNPRGREIGTVEVALDGTGDDRLFAGLGETLCVQATHVQSVLELPAGAVRLASNGVDPNHAFRAAPRAWGVQFHPEFDAPIMRGYLRERREVLAAEGLDADAILRNVRDSAHGSDLLRRFAELALPSPASV